MDAPTEAIVLAGGLGTRLRPVVADVPKPLAPIAGKPFLFWLLDGLARQGIGHVLLATGYMSGAIAEVIGPAHAGMRISHLPEPAPLGTGGAIWAALGACSTERVLVANGDSWIGARIADLAAHAPAADIVLTLRPVPDRARYGSVRLAGDQVLGLDEKGQSGPGLVNAGLYLMRADLPARRMMPASFSLETEVFARPDGLDVRGWQTDAPFIDIGTPQDFAAAQALLPRWAAQA